MVGNDIVDLRDPEADPLFITVTLSWDTLPKGSVTRIFRTIRTR